MIPLVMVHGFMGGAAQWAGQKERLGREVITLDLPGFGDSADLPVINSIGGFADWMIDQLRTRGVTRYHLLGHSMGGMIAQEMARRDTAQIARLILYATGAIGVLPGRFESIETSKERATTDGPTATARRIAATWFLQREAAKEYPACAAIAQQAGVVAIHAGLDAMQAWSGEGALRKITPETLIVWGDCDRTYAWAQTQLLWSAIPNTQLAVVPACAHAVHLEKPEIFNALVRDFLA